MEYSKHNIFSKIHDSEQYFIINPLSGKADILNPSEAKRYQDKKLTEQEMKIFKQNGYIINSQQERKIFNEKYLDFIDERETDEIQIFFVPWYSCNFNCSYCFQNEYLNKTKPVKTEVIDAFFNYIVKEFVGRRKYLTLFGGEPLLNSKTAKSTVSYFIDQVNKYNLELAIVTNGYSITEYIDIITKTKIKEIQITIDGTEEVHDTRRVLRNGKGSFHKISKGVDLLLEKDIPVNVRMIIDKENVDNLPELAKYAIKKGWTKHPKFKTAFGRNYELHNCQTNSSKLFSRIEMYQYIYNLLLNYPEIVELHKPAFSIAKFIFENGELPEPLFDSCSGTKTEWAFDYTGRIYSCTATVGKTDEALGTFYPEKKLNSNLIDRWEERDVVSIPECKSCNVQLACGGGCASIAQNQTGKIHSPDCRPIKELLELGVSYYSM